jgi:phosphatidyl-myo-inositol dimannoside synthase
MRAQNFLRWEIFRYSTEGLLFCLQIGILKIQRTGTLLRPRVAIITSGVGTAHGGIGVVAQLMVSALHADTSVSVWRHPPSLPRFLRFGIVGIRSCLAGMRHPDFVLYDHVHLAVLHATIPVLRRIPYGVFLHGIEAWEPLLGRRREALLGANILLVNSATTDRLTRRVNPWLPKTQVVWLGVRGHDRPIDAGSLPPISLMIGRMSSAERYKGHDPMIDAWPGIKAAVPKAEFVIIGKGDDERRLRRRARRECLGGIKFCGGLSDRERDRLYQSSRILFYPSKQEGFGLAGTEAASFGLPVLGLAGTVIEELFPPGTGVVVAQSLAQKDLVEAVVPVLQNAQLASQLGYAAWKRVQSTFLEEHFAVRFRRALRALVPYNAAENSILTA